MDIKEPVTKVRNIAASLGGFIRRHHRASIAAVVGLVIIGPLLTGVGGEAFFLNLVGLGIGSLLVWGSTRSGGQRRMGKRQ